MVMYQGGKLDHADRLFHSMPETWNNCLTNPSDLKELTPEFFYLPDFLRCAGLIGDGGSATQPPSSRAHGFLANGTS